MIKTREKEQEINIEIYLSLSINKNTMRFNLYLLDNNRYKSKSD